MRRLSPLRLFLVWTAALAAVAAMASSSARAVALGTAVVQSRLGQPLRVVIPLLPDAGEAFAAECFRVAGSGRDAPAAMVTAKVSLERGALLPRLVVSTADAIAEPAIDVVVEGGCERTTRRAYVLQLEPPAADAPRGTSAAAAGARVPATRAPGQDTPPAAAHWAAARRDTPGSSGNGVARIVQRPTGTAGEDAAGFVRARLPAGGPGQRSGLIEVASADRAAPSVPPARRARPRGADSWNDSWWIVALAVGGLAAIAVGVILLHHGRRDLDLPEWTRGQTRSGPASITNISAEPVTLPWIGPVAADARSRGGPATARNTTGASLAQATTLPNPAAAAARAVSPIATSVPATGVLADDIEADLAEVRAVREVYADARREFEQDLGGNAILQAIEDAERDLLLEAPSPGGRAQERSPASDLVDATRRAKKAAA